ncbi:cellulase family glycosylhydrolase [Fibrobacter sp. UWEL]|uniref:cellulase family glycosylhydrolase n=1 Tax=Fibrobacter sp. UWEL TaxID=1896209 RepID=UPI00091B98A9|nr:cellulase family glycosylhydrolase [Fibrobacter sp. UWEL]SHL28845.1 endoglucanase [Fibrobacter sp. UWEL]
MKKVVAAALLAAATSAMAVSASRVGPVSTYGELKAAKISNKGQLVGSCPSYATTPVQVKGMSLFWSSAADSSTVFYSEKAVNRMVSEMNIEVIRFAMGVTKEKFDDKGRGYLSSETGKTLQLGYLKNVVNAAVENDIYVIIDWHIESATGNTAEAKEFFEYAAKEYGAYNNVIFEVWNEPNGASMSTVASHANAIIPVIRKYSDNLVLVGSPGWSSAPDECATSGINDDNYACTLHFYAATHCVGGGYDGKAETAMSKGVPVFASEWGTVSADGNGGANQSASQAWINWMNTNKVSWANWSASAINEGSAAFTNLAIDQGLTYSTSGNMVKGWMNGKTGYKDCGLTNGNASSNSGFSTGVANGTSTDIIDDLEDGDRYSYTGGWWSAFADSDDDEDGKGNTSISNKKWTDGKGKEVYDVLMAAPGGDKNTSKYVAGITDIKLSQGGYKYAPYVTIGLNLNADPKKSYDLSACKAISYKFKGASHNFRVETSKVTNWNFHYVTKDGSDDWKEVELSWDQFIQEDWGDNDKHFSLDKGMGAVTAFGWQVKGALDVPDSKQKTTHPYLYVDDVRCDGVAIKAIANAGDAPVTGDKSSSSTAVIGGKSSSSTAVIGGKSSSSTAVIGGKSSSSTAVVPVSSSSVNKTPNTVLVILDDLEDGNEVANSTGTWYAYTDKEPGGLSSITNVYDANLPGYVVVFPGTKDPTNGTAGFVGLTGIKWEQGEYTEAPFVALGLNLVADTSKGFDLHICEAIGYRYKGVHHKFKVQDGQVNDYAYHEYKLNDATEWTSVVITWDKLTQPTWTDSLKTLNTSNIKKMSWEAIGYKGFGDEDQPEIRELYVDDLTCMVYDPNNTSIKPVRVAQSGIKLAAVGANLNISVARSGMVKVSVFDMMGNMVMSSRKNMTAGNHQVSLESLTRGNYVVRVQNGSDMKAARIAIK